MGSPIRSRELMDRVSKIDPDASENTVQNIRNWLRNDTVPQLTLPRSLYAAFQDDVEILSFRDFVSSPKYYGKYLLKDGIHKALDKDSNNLGFGVEDIFRQFKSDQFEFSFYTNESSDSKRKIAIGISLMLTFVFNTKPNNLNAHDLEGLEGELLKYSKNKGDDKGLDAELDEALRKVQSIRSQIETKPASTRMKFNLTTSVGYLIMALVLVACVAFWILYQYQSNTDRTNIVVDDLVGTNQDTSAKTVYTFPIDSANYWWEMAKNVSGRDADLNEKLRYLNKCLSYNPRHPFAWRAKAQTFYNLDGINVANYDSAVRAFEMLKTMEPLTPLDYMVMGLMFRHCGKFENAIKILDEGISKPTPLFHLKNLYAERGLNHDSLGNYLQAASDYSNVLRIDSIERNGASLTDNGLVFAKRMQTKKAGSLMNAGDHESALEAFFKLTPSYQSSPNLDQRIDIAYCYYMLGRKSIDKYGILSNNDYQLIHLRNAMSYIDNVLPEVEKLFNRYEEQIQSDSTEDLWRLKIRYETSLKQLSRATEIRDSTNYYVSLIEQAD